MKYHTGNTTKSSTRVRLAFCAFCVVAAVTLAGVALAAGPEHPSARGSKAQIVAENPDASAPSQASSGQNPIAEKYKTLVMRVYFGDRAERDRLAQELQPEEVPTTGGYLTVIRDRDLYYGLTARGLRVEIDENSSRNLSDPQLMLDTFYNGYKTVEEMYTFLDQKVTQFPTLAEKVDIGDSWCKSHPGACVLPNPSTGYDLFVLHITNRNIPGPKPVFWADGNIHSREIATPEVVMRLIDYLLNNYDTNADVHWLVDHHDIWLMPTVNPDGHHVVESGGGGNAPYMYRKNGNNSVGSCSWPPTSGNHSGVDANRNFPFHWGCCNGSSGIACEQTYRGTSSGSEPEDMAIVNKLRTLVPDQRGPGDTDAAPITAMGVYQNIHTVVPVNLFTWGWTATQMPNYAETRNIAAHMNAPNAGGNGYPFGSIIDQLYPVDGGSIDWAYGELGMAAFSTELSGQDFLPNYQCIDNPGCGSAQGIWPENRGMLLYLAKIARTPYLTSHGPDANTVVTNPTAVPPGTPAQLTASITFAWTGNAFSQNVGAAEYYIDTPPWAGGTAIPMSGTFTSPTAAVNATINTAGLSIGRHIIFVRGRGANDFQSFQTWGPVTAAFLDVTGIVTPTPSPTLSPGITPSPTPTATATATATVPPTPSPSPSTAPIADVVLNMADSPDPVQVGENLTYTITVSVGDIPPGGHPLQVSVNDAFPLSVTFVSVTPSQGSCSSSAGGIGCSLGTLPANSSATVVLVVTPTNAGSLSNTATAASNAQDPNSSNNSATTSTTVLPVPTPTPTLSPGITPSPTPTATATIAPTATPSLTPGATVTPTATPAQAVNISTRMFVQAGDNAGIGGFIISGSAPKHVLLRVVGPSLTQFGVPNALVDPTLELHGPGGFTTINNDNWQDDPAQAALIQASGLAPTNNLESAIDATLNPGAYTAVARGKNNGAGVGLIEVFDLSQAVLARLANISTRAFVNTGNDIVIAGFILGGSNGNDRIVVRGIGPSLTVLGVTNALTNPTLELRDNNGALLLANNDWQEDAAQAAELTAAGLAPTNPLESGIATALPPGLYTALLAGFNNATGVGVVEVYDRGAP